MKEFNISLSDEEIQKLQTINIKNLVFNDFLKEIIREKINYIKLDNGFFYDFSNKSLYDNKGAKVNLTKKESVLFEYLLLFSIENKDKFADIESITLNVWKDEDASVFSIRNKVKSIREKTFYELIKNKNSIGYRVNLNSLQINKD